MWDRLIELSRRQGPIPKGHFRVATIEADAHVSSRDFTALGEAKQYADDAASETGDTPPVAIVLDDNGTVVYQGKPYYSGESQ